MPEVTDREAAEATGVLDTAISMEVETPAGTFGSFTEAAEAGHPFACEQFARCENAADIALPHPVLTAVPTCYRCAMRVGAMA